VKPRLLDLFCGAGGAAMGYHRAGFEVVGVDIAPQPRYPFEFCHADAFEFFEYLLDAGFENWWDFDAIHASPPCQRWAASAHYQGNDHPDLVTPLRVWLDDTHLPYVIENVPRAPLRQDVVLCGTQFGLEADGFEVRRHRIFEVNWPFGSLTPPCQHQLPAMPVFGHTPNADFYKRHGFAPGADAKRQAMGIDWMNRNELAEAIPPAFTEFVGAQLLAHLESSQSESSHRPARLLDAPRSGAGIGSIEEDA
jgi:Site-specific DNA methylase